jgi:signal transduction histidine kinase
MTGVPAEAESSARAQAAPAAAGPASTLAHPDGRPAADSTGAGGRRVPRQLAASIVIGAAVVAIVAAGHQVSPSGARSGLELTGSGLAVLAAVAAAFMAGSSERTPHWLVAAGALTGAGSLAFHELAGGAHGGSRQAALSASGACLLALMAISVHVSLSLPQGRLSRPRPVRLGAASVASEARPSKGRRAVVASAYGAALATAIALGVTGQSLNLAAGLVAWAATLALTLPSVRLSYLASAGRDRERMQWLAASVVLGGSLALAATVLHVLVGWPGPLGVTAAACAGLPALGLIAGCVQSLGASAGRFLVQLIALAGFLALVSAIYLIIVLGVGSSPASSADRDLLGLSMLAAAVAAVGYLPARERLLAWAKHAVYGAREAPDEALRTFGSRLTRAVPMDELLLQLAESLRKTMTLTSAEVYIGSEVLERTVSVPDLGPHSIVVTPRELAVITRAGVSGTAWATVWLPGLVDGREHAQLRVAPVSHGGRLLGLIAAERPEGGDAFTDDDDRVLTELARQVGLAQHNAQLDSALANSLDELRAQAEALRESRARIVASGDAERRRLERNLHDGAQQNLVALAVSLRLAKDVLADDPQAAGQMLDQLADDIKVTIAELRDLAHGIYPPLLADGGLVRALEAAANRSPLAVRVTGTGIDRYPAEVEAAIYFCCLEALQNAAKHAPGSTVEIRLWTASGGLLFSVTDDGPGFDPVQALGGHGYVNMADRLGAIGGTVRWHSEPGQGATVQGSVPLT